MDQLLDPAYVRFVCSDLEATTRFAQEIVGLDLVEDDDGVRYFRADERHHALAVWQGPEPGLAAAAIEVRDESALESVRDKLKSANVVVHELTTAEVEQRRVRAGIAFRDEEGNPCEFVVGPQHARSPLERPRTRGIIEFGHAGLNVTEMDKNHRLWTETLGLQVTDWIGDRACLLRYDNIHHKLALFAAQKPGLNHMNFQVNSIDEVMRQWRRCLRNDVPIVLGPGRHPTSGAIFIYFSGPDGLVCEYSFGVEELPNAESWVTRYFEDAPTSIDMWGGPPPTALF